jgi:hypothetical protein
MRAVAETFTIRFGESPQSVAELKHWMLTIIYKNARCKILPGLMEYADASA